MVTEKAAELVWYCQTCKQRITKLDAGYLQVSHRDIADYRRSLAEWEHRVEAANPPNAKLRTVTGGLLLDHPRDVRWHVTCTSCDPDSEGGWLYWFSLDRAATWQQLVEWTAHLLETKEWLPLTDWHNVLREAIARNSPAR